MSLVRSVIIKHKLSLSDVETVRQIHPPLHVIFCRNSQFSDGVPPFAPSLLVDIRKRMRQSVFDVFEQEIIDAHEGEKEKTQTQSTSASMPQIDQIENKESLL